MSTLAARQKPSAEVVLALGLRQLTGKSEQQVLTQQLYAQGHRKRPKAQVDSSDPRMFTDDMRVVGDTPFDFDFELPEIPTPTLPSLYQLKSRVRRALRRI